MMDLIDRQQAIELIEDANIEAHMDSVMDGELHRVKRAVQRIIASMPSARPNGKWIPIKMRPMTAEERAYFEEHFGPCLDCEAVMYDCPMPEDGQSILISTRWGVDVDTCDADGQFMGLETRGDWNGVLAWMPLPEPYAEDIDG